MTTKEVKLNSDTHFLSICKKRQLIPKGLKIKNSLATMHKSQYAENLCKRTSEKLRNHLIHQLYNKKYSIQHKKQYLLQNLREENTYIAKQLEHDLHYFYKKQQRDLFKKKNNKLIRFQQDYHKHLSEKKKWQEKSGIVNISDYKLSDPVLSKGLSFCPSTKLVDIGLYSNVEEFFRRMRLKEYFHDKESTVDYNNRKKNTNFTPAPGRNAKLDSYIKSFCLRTVSLTTKQNQKKMFHNLSVQEQMAINYLKNNHAIDIKPADKGGAVVIMNTQDYIKEGDRQLSDDKYYRKLNEDPTKEYTS
ncbi:Hypothetical predicted protein [Pelobates cultripes]|uniref:Uncharacterized protein n=1 Tax=Pelobates cultripes TaxID=61616 RepID=A0AAD1R4Q7_PELCU|nr:Hypothetical predicted protein [Pelobates cultripes]